MEALFKLKKVNECSFSLTSFTGVIIFRNYMLKIIFWLCIFVVLIASLKLLEYFFLGYVVSGVVTLPN